jgi:hypothetical protein
MAADKINRLKRVRTKQQDQMAADEKQTRMAADKKQNPLDTCTLLKPASLRLHRQTPKFRRFWEFCGVRPNALNATLHCDLVLIYRMGEREILFRILVGARDISLPQNIQTGTEV